MFGRGNVQKVNWQDPNLLSQVFPTIPSNMLDKSDEEEITHFAVQNDDKTKKRVGFYPLIPFVHN